MGQTITVTIRDGKAVVETKGFRGASCLKATEELERALGATTKDVKTAEYHQQAAQPQKQGG